MFKLIKSEYYFKSQHYIVHIPVYYNKYCQKLSMTFAIHSYTTISTYIGDTLPYTLTFSPWAD